MSPLLILSPSEILPLQQVAIFGGENPHTYQKAGVLSKSPPTGIGGSHMRQVVPGVQHNARPLVASVMVGVGHLQVTVITGMSQGEHTQTSHPPP